MTREKGWYWVKNIEGARWHPENQQLNIAGVSGSCYVCGKKFAEKEITVDMYGEEVCQQCADHEMYNMLGNIR